MITIFNRKQLCTTFDSKYQADVKEILRNNKIDYATKVVNRKSSSPFGDTSRARTGTIGENVAAENEYIIYVKKEDLEMASHLIKSI